MNYTSESRANDQAKSNDEHDEQILIFKTCKLEQYLIISEGANLTCSW